MAKTATGQTKIARSEVFTIVNAPIPAGFYYVGGTVNTGYIISDCAEDTEKGESHEVADTLKGNQFVWIPVEVTASDTETNIAAFQRNSSYPRSDSTWSNYTEPYSKGSLTVTNDLTGEYAEYAEMVKSVYHHKGFYVARYEAGCEKERTDTNKAQAEYQGIANPVLSQKNKFVYNYVPWGASMESVLPVSVKNSEGNEIGTVKGAVELTRGMYPASNTGYGAVSHLMYGVQWDAVMKFVQDGTHNVTDSSSWGNHTDYTGEGTYEQRKLQKTGVNENWKAKNMYDLAGNAWEWTMEAYHTDNRVIRGGRYDFDGAVYPTSYRNLSFPDSMGHDSYTFRAALYVKNN